MNMKHAWSAKLVLELQPQWLRNFFLCERNARSHDSLRTFVATHNRPPNHSVRVFFGDFNVEIDQILIDGRLKPTEAAFALLDQRMFECQWETVRKIANKKTTMKIEQFYFFGLKWAKRSLSGVTKNFSTIERWWGRSDYMDLKQLAPEQISESFVDRFRTELGYKHVQPYPIFKRIGTSEVMYHMIHASDHDEAPKLMNRAYRRAVRDWKKPAEQLTLIDLTKTRTD